MGTMADNMRRLLAGQGIKPVAGTTASDSVRGQVMALPEARGRERLAAHLADNGMSVAQARAALAAAPKARPTMADSMRRLVEADTRRP